MKPSSVKHNAFGWWTQAGSKPQPGQEALKAALIRVTQPLFLIELNGYPAVSQDGTITIGAKKPEGPNVMPLLGYVPALHPQDLGDSEFKRRHNLRYAYIVGAMANGITSVEMVSAAGRSGMVGFYGAAGLALDEIDSAIDRLQKPMGKNPFGFNLIHSPFAPELEAALVELYLRRGIRRVSASAYLDLTPSLVYYRVKGIHRTAGGEIRCPNKIIAKVSRIEIAKKFLSPPPPKILERLVTDCRITRDEAFLATSIPMADDLTAEADSGGHTDNRPAITLLPTMLALRDEMVAKYKYEHEVCVGLGGGIATPYSAAAAFAMGAAYVLTGSVNQACVEAGTSKTVCRMLADAKQADVTMAPAADMFELGVKVQVLKRGTMFPLRAAKLYELYSSYDSYEDIPARQREMLERDFFKCTFTEEWEQTKNFFIARDPAQITRAEADAKHKMALVFRSYLGKSSTWAKAGDPQRRIDYQIWCGPAMGAFNQWAKGSFLENPENRTTVCVAMNLLFGAAVATRVSWLRSQGLAVPAGLAKFTPMQLSEILGLLDG